MPTPMLYRPTDVMDVLSLSRSTVYALLKSGELESVTIGSSRRVTAVALEAFVDRQVEAARAEAEQCG